MNQEQPEKPIRFADVFAAVQGSPEMADREMLSHASASLKKASTAMSDSTASTDFPGTESSGGQATRGESITIGEALEAAVLTAGKKPVEWSDAAAIQAAEVRATGRTNIMPGGVAASAQSAATLNARAISDEDKTTLADILTDASKKLPWDRAVTRKDAEGVTGAEMRNDPYLTPYPTGVAASIAAAARINQNK